ncbi:MAG: flavin reductase family protein [Actinomycetota bacterium]|nr:flavin reductase family protein [Actinomycetota bacterium]
MRQEYDAAEMGRTVYGLLTSIVVPRPIAWVSTRSVGGVDNLAPHSFFTISCVQPPVVQFTSVGTKDSLRNAVDTGEFVVCMATAPLADKVNVTGTEYPPDVSEFDMAGVTREPSVAVTPFRVAESPVAIECRLLTTTCFGDSTVVFGEVLHLAVDEAVLRDGRPAIDLLEPVSRLGGPEWGSVGEVAQRPRIPYVAP